MDHQAYFHYQPPALESPTVSPTTGTIKPRPPSSSGSSAAAAPPATFARPQSSGTGALRNYSYDGGIRQNDDSSHPSSSLLPPLYEGHISSAPSPDESTSPTTAAGPSTLSHHPHHPSHPPPSQSHHGFTIRNTRPMTAPGSVSTPYYGATAGDFAFSFGSPPSSGGLSSHDTLFNHHHHHTPPTTTNTPSANLHSFVGTGASGGSSAGQTSSGAGAPATLAGAGGNTYPVVTSAEQRMMEAHMMRTNRGLSLPELPGLPSTALPDEHHPYASQFAHMPPPTRYVPLHGTGTPLSYSRPTTADSRPNTTSSIISSAGGPLTGDAKLYSFVALPGTPKKRPRRRYDEIERMYGCNYPGCTKAYGTLNHLNAHITMQKHGPKRTPAEFKEARKEWRARKKQQDEHRVAAQKAALANGHGQAHGHPHVVPAFGLPGTFLHALPRPPQHVIMNPYGDLRPQTAPSPAGPFFHHPVMTDPTPPSSSHGHPHGGHSSSMMFGHHPPPSSHGGHMLPPIDGGRRMSLPVGSPGLPHLMRFGGQGEDEVVVRAKTSAGTTSAWGGSLAGLGGLSGGHGGQGGATAAEGNAFST